MTYSVQRPKENATPDDIESVLDRVRKRLENLEAAKSFMTDFMDEKYPKPKWRYHNFKIYSQDGTNLLFTFPDLTAKQLATGSNPPGDISTLFNEWWKSIEPRVNQEFMGKLDLQGKVAMVTQLFLTKAPEAKKMAMECFVNEGELRVHINDLASAIFKKETAQAG